MSTTSRPHAGSLAFYPRKRASKETSSFSSFPVIAVKEGEKSRPLNFLAYKAGMTHVLGKDIHSKSITSGHEIAIATTVLEAPPMKVFGVRAYGKAPKNAYGTDALIDILAENVDKNLLRKVHSFKKKSTKKKSKKEETAKKEAPKEEKKATFADLEKIKDKILSVRLLCHSQPAKTGIGKKKPDLCEVALAGNIDQGIEFAKEKIGKEIKISDVFKENTFIDIKAVTKGKGMQGPVKRAGIKIQRPKAKKQRVVGSISPWNPSTVMWQVARPGHMGYNNRTEYNKKILKIGTEKEVATANPTPGFKTYGLLKNDFILLAGSVAGPSKRVISMRIPIRATPTERHQFKALDYIAGTTQEPAVELEEEVKVAHAVEKKEGKVQKKSVAEEIASAAKGEEKREKSKQK